jgi:hypothetical protein
LVPEKEALDYVSLISSFYNDYPVNLKTQGIKDDSEEIQTIIDMLGLPKFKYINSLVPKSIYVKENIRPIRFIWKYNLPGKTNEIDRFSLEHKQIV